MSNKIIIERLIFIEKSIARIMMIFNDERYLKSFWEEASLPGLPHPFRPLQTIINCIIIIIVICSISRCGYIINYIFIIIDYILTITIIIKNIYIFTTSLSIILLLFPYLPQISNPFYDLMIIINQILITSIIQTI